jgi:hypothetical protein
VLGGALEDAARLIEVAASVLHQLDPQPVPATLLDFVEVAPVGVVRIVGFLVVQLPIGSQVTLRKRLGAAWRQPDRGAPIAALASCQETAALKVGH